MPPGSHDSEAASHDGAGGSERTLQSQSSVHISAPSLTDLASDFSKPSTFQGTASLSELSWTLTEITCARHLMQRLW